MSHLEGYRKCFCVLYAKVLDLDAHTMDQFNKNIFQE